jgi:acyl-CoA synthetase (AMP-forming)/AMP-acid ligase II
VQCDHRDNPLLCGSHSPRTPASPYGYVYIVDREKDMILTGGVNAYPAEIERLIAQHPTIALVAVGSLPDDLKGEIAKACIEAKTGAAAYELRSWRSVASIWPPASCPARSNLCTTCRRRARVRSSAVSCGRSSRRPRPLQSDRVVEPRWRPRNGRAGRAGLRLQVVW